MKAALKKYCLGFFFSRECDRVVLIQKTHPKWQAGKLNGIGGHIEEGEEPIEAMIREFQEEAYLYVPIWHPSFRIINTNVGYDLHVFRAYGPIDSCRPMTDEELIFADVMKLPDNVILNLRWMIPMMLDSVDLPLTIIDYGNS